MEKKSKDKKKLPYKQSVEINKAEEIALRFFLSSASIGASTFYFG